MSSGRYVRDLRVDRRARRVLLACGLLAWLAGALLAPALPLPLGGVAVLLALWSAASWLELRSLVRGMARIDRIRITSAGEVWGLAPGGERQALELLPGSVVLRRGAWLRLRFPDGCRSGEWLLRESAGSEAWCLLELLWQQRGGRFGGPRRS